MLRLIITALLCLSLTANAVERSSKARADFIRLNPCPATGSNKPHYKCPGYIVDHVRALACDGADHHSNMQWQSVQDAKAKDRWERKGC